MDIFKLIYQHDLLLEHLPPNSDPRNKAKEPMNVTDFMTPDPTYCTYYLTGTRLDEMHFGLNTLTHYHQVIRTLEHMLQSDAFHLSQTHQEQNLTQMMENNTDRRPVLIGSPPDTVDVQQLDEIRHSDRQHRYEAITGLLDQGLKILFFEKAHNGFDLHLFSRDNLYEAFFHNLKPLVGPDFRYFSINGKRVSSEPKFYFETWTLERPPHGFEEVTSDAVL